MVQKGTTVSGPRINLHLCRIVSSFLNVGREFYELELKMNILSQEIAYNIADIENILSKHTDLLKTRDERDRLVILLLLIFFEKTFTFDLKISNYFLKKVQKYSKASSVKFLQDNHEPLVKKYIVKRNRYFSVSTQTQRISFLQMYYLSKRAKGLRGIPQAMPHTWDFKTLVNKDRTLEILKQHFDEAFDIDNEIKLYGGQLKRLFESVLSDPFTNADLKKMGLSLLTDQRMVLLCFLREKSIYHVLRFKSEDSRLDRRQYSEYSFEYSKLAGVMDCKAKLSNNTLLLSLASNADHNKDDKLDIFDQTLAVRLQDFLYKAVGEGTSMSSMIEGKTITQGHRIKSR